MVRRDAGVRVCVGGKNQDPVSLSLYHAHTHTFTHTHSFLYGCSLFSVRLCSSRRAKALSGTIQQHRPSADGSGYQNTHTHTIPLLSTLIFHQITCPAFLASRYNPNADPTGRKKAARPIKSKRVLKKNTPFQTFSFLRQKRSGESVAPCSALTSLCWLR